MCELVTATTLAYIAIGAAVAGTGVSVMGQMQQAKSQKAMAGHQAKVAEYNAEVAEQNRVEQRKATDYNVLRHYERAKQLQGQQRSLMSGAGVELSSGSSLELLGGTAALREREADQIRYDGAMRERGFEIQQQQSLMDASAARMRRRAIGRALPWKIGGTLLSGVSSAASMGAGYKSKGII